ncbi:MAG: hypothetical protein F6K53_20300 [Moorea sp. SIO4A1]|uniref:hypothetical protein n=1 Tax=Moorena sp. SIO4A1 TaxID=2607835 RepID=UPI00144B549C|nr:hypothetical protein [Moorena sp. SIO4A1]NEQ59614.1 hypothetical protein [Moorena sp. SIO4A1]
MKNKVDGISMSYMLGFLSMLIVFGGCGTQVYFGVSDQMVNASIDRRVESEERQKDRDLQSQKNTQDRARELADNKAKNKIINGFRVYIASEYYYNPAAPTPPTEEYVWKLINNIVPQSKNGYVFAGDSNNPTTCFGWANKKQFYFVGSPDKTEAQKAKDGCTNYHKQNWRN